MSVDGEEDTWMISYGLERVRKYSHILKNKRLGLVTTVASVDRSLSSSVDILSSLFDVKALYSPEHGLRGDVADGQSVETYIDVPTGLPVYSLYRQDSQRLSHEMVEGIEVMVFDVQDLGLRFYTYIATLKNLMEDCALFGIPLVVLDRPNPLGGMMVEGNLLKSDSFSFVGPHSLPIRYGLTIGELACLFKAQSRIDVDCTVVPMSGWKRKWFFDQLGRTWMMTSPAIGHFTGALLYAGMCLFEGTNISEGRGTSCPFELIGAPFIEAESLCRDANGMGMEGILFTPAYFTPASSKYQNEVCQGLYAHVVDQRLFHPVETAVRLISLIQRQYPADFWFLQARDDAGLCPFERLAGKGSVKALTNDCEGMLAIWKEESVTFSREKRQYHLYP